MKPPLNDKKTSCHSFGAVFAEVAADPDLGVIRTRRVVAVYDAGKIVNQKLARSQAIGGIDWGIGLALLEDTQVDPRNGRIMNANFADYHLPVNADIREIQSRPSISPTRNWIRSASEASAKLGLRERAPLSQRQFSPPPENECKLL